MWAGMWAGLKLPARPIPPPNNARHAGLSNERYRLHPDGPRLRAMSGTPSADYGDSDGYQDSQGAPENGPADRGPASVVAPKQSFPWQLGASVLAWVLLGGLLIASALGVTSTTSEADQGSIDSIRGALGQSAVASTTAPGQHPTLYLLIGFLILLAALMLLIGQSWARLALTLLGVVTVILLAIGGRWETVVAFVLLVLGAILLLNRPVQRYLNR
jgi:hypothetical protein